MSQYYITINDYLEDKACYLINQALENSSYKIDRNNLDSNDIDLKTIDKTTSNLYATVDVQYSMEFQKYGDVRIDLMSAGTLINNINKEIWQLNKQIEFSENHLSEFKSLFTINKYGKYFDKNAKNMVGIFYYFYKNKFTKNLEEFKTNKADFYFFLPKWVVLNEIRKNPKITIKINDKKANHIYETHHSAFACLNVNELIRKYNLPIFKTEEELISKFYTVLINEIEKP